MLCADSGLKKEGHHLADQRKFGFLKGWKSGGGESTAQNRHYQPSGPRNTVWLFLWLVFVSPGARDAKKTLMSSVASFLVGLSRLLAPRNLIFFSPFFLFFFFFFLNVDLPQNSKRTIFELLKKNIEFSFLSLSWQGSFRL